MVSDVSLEMYSDSKNYVGLQDDEITEPVHTIKLACASSAVCLFGTAKRFLKLLWNCSGRIRQACAYHKITAHWFLSDCRSRSQIDSVNVH